MDITKCDKCKRLKRKSRFLDRNSEWIDGSLHGQGEYFSFDLCGQCSENLVKYIKKYIGVKETSK